jgi:hypothetical protein
MDWGRWFRHLFSTRGDMLRAFPPSTLGVIEAAITDTERMHSGEVRFAIEASLEPHDIWHGLTPRQRALRVFAALGAWDTEANNGVLIYVLLADRDVEIVADRGFNGKVRPEEWSARGTSRAGRSSACAWLARSSRDTSRSRPGHAIRTNCRTGPRCCDAPVLITR